MGTWLIITCVKDLLVLKYLKVDPFLLKKYCHRRVKSLRWHSGISYSYV